MKILLKLISVAVLICVVYLSILNSSTKINLYPMYEEPVNLMVYSLAILLLGVFAGAVLVGSFYFDQRGKVNAYKRKLEKSSVDNVSNESKVKVLEAKIVTLEKALDEALSK